MNSDKAKVKYFSRQVWTGVIGLKARHESAFGSSGLLVAWNEKVERERARRATQGRWIGGQRRCIPWCGTGLRPNKTCSAEKYQAK
jgi:hypothetical protein